MTDARDRRILYAWTAVLLAVLGAAFAPFSCGAADE